MPTGEMMEEYIELGDFGWRHPEAPNILFGEKCDSITDYSKKGYPQKMLDPNEWYHVDTRPDIDDVKELLKDEEEVWDEYFSNSAKYEDDQKWPYHYGRLAVFVVHGGSEGLYLHVDVVEEGRLRTLLLGKTLDCSLDKWNKCWESAGRIARRLQA